MNSEKFLNLIINPSGVSKKETTALETVLEEFPYFQTARVLHLKGLKNQHSFKYNKELKKTAAFTTNRTVLFDFITKNTLDFDKVSKSEKDILDDIEIIDSKVIDHLYKSINAFEDNKETLDKESKIENDLKESYKVLTEKLEKNREVLEINKPINFKKEDTFSFNEWLQLKTIEPIIRKAEVKEEIKAIKKTVIEDVQVNGNATLESTKNVDLIAKFIKNNPKIKLVKDQVQTNIPIDSSIENTNLMTETLARVYLEQKKYKKAITAFKILSLKYPEKSSFFADRIKAINFLEKYKS